MDEFEKWCAEMGASGAVNCFIPSREDLRKAFSAGLAKGRKEGIGKIGTVCIYDGCTNTQYDNLKGIERGTYDLYAVRQATPIK